MAKIITKQPQHNMSQEIKSSAADDSRIVQTLML